MKEVCCVWPSFFCEDGRCCGLPLKWEVSGKELRPSRASDNGGNQKSKPSKQRRDLWGDNQITNCELQVLEREQQPTSPLEKDQMMDDNDSYQKRMERNEKARVRAQQMRQRIGEIEQKSPELRTEEEASIYANYQAKRQRKNQADSERAQKKKDELNRIMNLPSEQRTPQEQRLLDKSMNARKRKNEKDAERRQQIKGGGYSNSHASTASSVASSNPENPSLEDDEITSTSNSLATAPPPASAAAASVARKAAPAPTSSLSIFDSYAASNYGNGTSRSARTAQAQKKQMEEIKRKPVSERTPEEIAFFEEYEERRLKKNRRRIEWEAQRKAEVDRIMAIPEEQRTDKEAAFVFQIMDAKRKKNEGDRARRQRQKLEKMGITPTDDMLQHETSTAAGNGVDPHIGSSIFDHSLTMGSGRGGSSIRTTTVMIPPEVSTMSPTEYMEFIKNDVLAAAAEADPTLSTLAVGIEEGCGGEASLITSSSFHSDPTASKVVEEDPINIDMYAV